MKQFANDELDELPVASSKPATTTATATEDEAEEVAIAPAVVTTSVKDELEDDDEVPAVKSHAKPTPEEDEVFESVEFGDQKLISRSDGLNRIRPDKEKVARFALLPFLKGKDGKPLALMGKSHFVDIKDKKGTFRCAPVKSEDETPYCCQKLDAEGMVHVVALAIHYVNADSKTGMYVKGTPIEWEVGYVDLSRSNFRSVSALTPEDSSVYDIDIVMSKKTSGIGYEFVAKTTKAKWKQNPELAAEVEAAAQKFVKDGGKKLNSKLGRKLTAIEWRALLSGLQAASGKEASLEDIDDM
jgi:hypothetical protein